MFHLLRNVPIRFRLGAAVTLPLLFLIGLATWQVVSKRQDLSQTARASVLVDLAPTISALVHELQKERGMSSGFIGSKGAKFADKLPQQRRETSERLAALKTAFAGWDAQLSGESLPPLMTDAEKRLNQLQDVREKVTQLGLTVPETAGYYTQTIASLLHIVEHLGVLSTEANAAKAVVAYTTLLQAKEGMGVQRAMGAAGFAAGAFSSEIYERFLQVIARQETFLQMFGGFASPEHNRIYAETVVGPAVDEVARMQRIAIESAQTGSTQGVQADSWFAAITQKIDLVKKVEDRLSVDLRALSAARRDQAEREYLIVLVSTILVVLATIAVVVAIARSITGPFAGITAAMRELAAGDTAVPVPALDRADEIGRMANAVAVFKQNAVERQRLEAQAAEEIEVRGRRTAQMEALIKDFEREVAHTLAAVGAAATEMQGTSRSMSATAEETSRQATVVAAASEQASVNVQTVASAAEQLASSVHEIGRQVAQSSQIADRAVGEADKTNAQVQMLADSAEKIGDVVKLISDIAAQTNLLALNATIEAARAGEAGKGFAVVASEVKSLATQTARATQDIAGQIKSIQSATGESVTAIDGIGKTIRSMNEIAATIAAAVEEQQAATQEIARNVQQASAGTSEVSSNIGGVSSAASEAGTASSQVLNASQDLARHSETLRGEISTFLSSVRAA